MKPPRDFAKIKLVGPFKDVQDYRRQWRKEYTKDPKRLHLVNSPEYKAYMKAYSKEYRQRDDSKKRKNEQTRASRALLRLEILDHYSNGALVCCRCGYGDVRALDLDHMDNSGGDHRKAVGIRGATYDIYAELKRNNFPEGYQILCRNCNWIKEVENRTQRRCDTLTATTINEVSNG